MQLYKARRNLLVPIVSCAVAMAGEVNAAGFALIEQSTKSLGNAFAGAAALGEDASAIYFNPAGLTRLARPELVVAAHYISPKNTIYDAKSSHLSGATVDINRATSEAGVSALVPNIYFAAPIAPGLHAGIGIGVPFGLATNYVTEWAGKYHAKLSELATVSITPTLALKPSEQFSLGAGLNIEHANAVLSNRIDLGMVCLGAEAAAQLPTGSCTGLGLLPTKADGSVTVKGDDWGVGFVLGALFTVNASTRFGATYHSPVTHRLSGTADFAVPANASLFTGSGRFIDTGATAELKLPETISASVFHSVDTRWQLLGDVTWTKWNRFQELRVEFDNPAQPSAVQPERWENTWRLSVGANLVQNDRLMWRAGIARDQSPIANAELRTPRVPDSDRTWLAIGVQMQLNPSATLDAGYAHIFIDKAEINNKEENTGYLLTGNVESRVDIASLQLTWKLP